jgi:thiol-disulfide isomerase/thioredoxin
MRKLFFIGLLLLCTFNGTAQLKPKMSFQAEITNRNTDSIFIRNRQNGKVLKTIAINKAGIFKDTLSIAEGVYMLYDGKEYAKIFIKNGYDLKLKIDAQKFDESMVFSGKGAVENNYMAQSSLLETKYDYTSLLASDEGTFKRLVEAKKSAGFAGLENTNLDVNFKALQKADIENSITGLTAYYNQVLENNKLNGSVSPSFDYDNYKGGKTKLEDFKGKYVYIDIWATWCGPCIGEIPSLKKVEEKYHDKNIVFVSISIDKVKDMEKWKKMIEKKELGGIQLIADNDWNSKFIQDFKVTSIPRFILLDPKGNIIKADAERPSSPKLEIELDILLN